MKDIGFVYKWVDSSNGMWYIGSHKGNPDDGYIGSGTRFTNAYSKRPESFNRQIIYIGSDYRELEDFILEELDAANDTKSYNLKNKACGFDTGKNNPKFGGNKGKDNPRYGKKVSEETRLKMSKNCPDRNGENNAFYGKSHSEESKKKIARANNRAVFIESINMSFHSIAEASRFLGVSKSRLYNILYGNTKNHIGITYINK